MHHMALLNTQHRVLLILSLIGSSLLTGCADQSWFERFYKPAPASHASPNHLEKAYAVSEAIPICGPIREPLPTGVSGLFWGILSASGTSTVRSNPPATPQLVWSSDPDGDGKRLAQQGYVLMGTSSFLSWEEFSFSNTAQGRTQQAIEQSTAQGKRVGAGVVLLKVPYTMVCAVGEGGASNPLELRELRAVEVVGPHTGVFASYWAKANAPQ